ncbi:hypothetical protein MA16_Dca022368 [Dendrobium catenatum]|uniref:Uncharacterized protein n=1 Tax=Dendrobium catenatum TaxID=906689 RepID=A0A2I0VT83_9ASPA|nr:hypothetical protein MA16_Dca022368 [Dendrobium catenatum]
MLEGNFMKGLKPDMRASVLILRVQGLGEAIELAQLVEDKNSLERSGHSSSLGVSYHTTNTFLTPKMQTMPIQKVDPRVRGQRVRRWRNFKRLTESEIQ